jgi:hypothetical protein
MAEIHPTSEELRLLKIGYSRFLDLYTEIIDDEFLKKHAGYRLRGIKDICTVYTELLKYPPLADVFVTETRQNYSLIGKEFILFLRNVLLHFPYFEKWSEIGFDQSLITTFERTGSIDKFLSKNHPGNLKYRFWNADVKKMTYVQVHLDTKYNEGEFVKLADIISERDGIKFLCIFMKDILMTQVEYVEKVNK